MAFEVFPVRGPIDSVPIGKNTRTDDEVADAITQVYNVVAAAGGSIIAAHTLRVQQIGDRRVNDTDLDCLFLVAEMPGTHPDDASVQSGD
jgi:hypothetical protein